MKLTVYAVYRQYQWENEPSITITSYEATKGDSTVFVRLGQFEIDLPIEIPERAEIVMAQVAGLREEQGKHQAAINALEHNIQELLCIECKAEV